MLCQCQKRCWKPGNAIFTLGRSQVIFWSRILSVCETIATIAGVADRVEGLISMGGLKGSDSYLFAAAL